MLDLAAPILGFFLGTFLFSRVGHWLEAIVSAVKASKVEGAPRGTIAVVAVLSSGPWILGGTIFWACYVLSGNHARPWDWFFGGVVIAIAGWLLFAIHLHRRGKRTKAAARNENNAV